MDLNRAKSVLAAIREEARRRDDAERDHYWAYEQGLSDEAFINEFCLIFLVALRHHLEGELVCLAARVGGAGTGITQAQFQQGIERLSTKGKTDWQEVNRLLKIDKQTKPPQIEALRLLANNYKHDPQFEPSADLIKHLNLRPASPNYRYADLSESDALQDGLAHCVCLSKGSNYILIAERFVESVEKYLESVVQNVPLRPFAGGAVSLLDCLH